jgi:AcrR family transcriptional regulator
MRLQAVIDHDTVTAPRQERSQRTLERILAALGELLSEKSFDQISMVELAERAGCAVTSIYARFKDKWSMIAALHESFRDDAIARIDSFLAPERWHGATADAIIAATTAELVAAYHEHRHLLHAVLLTDEPRVYSRAASVARHAAERLLEVLPAPAGVAADLLRSRVQFGVRVVIATLQQRVLLDAVPGEWVGTNADLARELANLMTSYLGYSRRRRSHPNRHTKRVGRR